MRILCFFSLALIFVVCGCSGPERKFSRGVNNITELTRGGEIHRSMEQAALWYGPDVAYTYGFVRGVNRSLMRTVIGAYEIVTGPFPPYGPLLTSTNRIYPDITVRDKTYPWGGMVLTEHPIYPDVYKPSLISDSIFSSDTGLGFHGGDVAPMIPGSKFKIFDN